MPPARLVPPLAMIRLLAMRTFSLWLLCPGPGRSGVPMRIVAVGAAVVLDHVVGDLQVAGVGVGEDRAALGRRRWPAGRWAAAADLVDVAREALLVAAAEVEAVDRRAVAGRSASSGNVPARAKIVDDRAVVDGLVAVPACSAADPGVPVGRRRGLSPPKAPPSMIEPGTWCSSALEAARADALELDRRGDDQVLVVGARAG